MEQELLSLPEHQRSPPVFSGVRVTRSLVLYVCFVDRCLSFCTFSFGHDVVCPSSICGFWLPFWYLQALHVKQLNPNWMYYRVNVMVFNATFNNISILLVEETAEYLEKTYLPQCRKSLTNFYHVIVECIIIREMDVKKTFYSLVYKTYFCCFIVFYYTLNQYMTI